MCLVSAHGAMKAMKGILRAFHPTWLVRWFSLATIARLSVMVISKSCRTGASAGLAPPAHFSRCSMLASSDASFSWNYNTIHIGFILM